MAPMTRPASRIAASAVAAVLALALVPAGSAVATPAAPATPLASVQGAALADATVSGRVTLAGVGVTSGTVQLWTLDGSLVRTVAIAADGTFSVAGVLPGQYLPQAVPATDSSWLATFSGNETRRPDGTPVTVAAASTTSVTIAVKQGATVTGRVVGASGSPVAGAQVEGFNTTRAGWASAVTDADGRYVLRRLSTGRVQVVAGKGASSGTTTVQAVRGDSVAARTITVRNTATGKVTGRVTRTNGTPLSVRVSLLDRSKDVVAEVRSTSTGRFSFPRLEPGTYRVVVNGSNVAKAVTVRQKRTSSVGTLRRGTVSPVRGILRGTNGKVVKGEIVRLVDSYGTSAGYARTNAQGRYTIKGVVKGRYTLSAARDARFDLTYREATFVARAGRPVSQSLRLQPTATLRATVVDTKGRPVEDLVVDPFSIDTVYGYDDYLWTKPDGTFVLRGIVPGRQALSIVDDYPTGYKDATVRFTAVKGRTITLTVTVRR